MASDLAVTRRAQVLRYLDQAEQHMRGQVPYVSSNQRPQMRPDANELAFKALPLEWQEALTAFSPTYFGNGTVNVETAIKLGFVERADMLMPLRDVPNVLSVFAHLRADLQVARDEDAVAAIVEQVRVLQEDINIFNSKED